MLGQLIVRLGLDASDFTQGLTKSDAQARKFAQSMQANVAGAIVKAEVATLAFISAARVAADVFQSLTTGAAKFQDLAEETGATAADLASLAVSAATAGVEMTSVAAATGKLTKGLVGVDDESKAAGAALKALNLNVADFKKLDPVAQYEAVGKALGNFADGAAKTAVAQALFGKAGAEQLKVFKALEEAGGRQSILTARQIALADEFADKQAKQGAQIKLYAQALAADALPALTAFTKAVVESVAGVTGLDTAAGRLSAAKSIREWAFDQAEGVAELGGKMQSLGLLMGAVGASSRVLASISPAVSNADARASFEDAKKAWNDYLKFDEQAMKKSVAYARTAATVGSENDPRRGRGFVGEAARPDLKFNGANTSGASILKKQLDGDLKAIRDYAEQEKDTFDFANRYLKNIYDDGLSDLRQYHDAQRQIREAALASQLTALDQEVQALQEYRKKAKDADRVDADNKIAEALAKRAQLVKKAGFDAVIAAQDEAQAVKALSDRYKDLQATILQLSGDAAGASAIRIAKQVDEARRLIAQTGGDPADADRLGKLLAGTEALNQVQRDYQRLLDATRASEEDLYLTAQQRGSSELETMQAIKSARMQTLDQMADLVRKSNELALSLKTPEAIDFARNLTIAFRKATAEADPLLERIRDVGKEMGATIASSFEDAVLSGKKLSDVLKSLEQDLIRIIYRQAVTKPFEKWLGDAIGGNGQSSGGGGWIGSLLGLFGGGKTMDTGSYGGGGYIGGGAAIGGPVMPNSLTRVAENRPEVFDDGSNQYLLTGSRGGRVDPNPRFGGGRTINQHIVFNVQGQIDTSTQLQLTARYMRAGQYANARGN